MARAGTNSRVPVAWLGSTITGRWVYCFKRGTAEMSRVLRVSVSKVRMPRSQSITCQLPRASTYSAESRSSLMLAIMPRFKSPGWSRSPTASSREKFCMLRAPICNTSA